MRTATLIVAAVSSLSLALPAAAQQPGGAGRGAAPGASFPQPPAPVRVAPPSAPQTGGSLRGPRPASGGWKSTTPGGSGVERRGRPVRPGGWRPGRPGGWQGGRPDGWRPGVHRPGWRWGGNIRGRWHAGWNAPGGWGAYRRPVRGWALPSYWIGGGFWITDWSNWGLSSPPHGYNWIRYYDDAVLVDPYGRVWDSVSGIDWDRDDDDRDDDAGYRDDYDADYDAPYGPDAPPAVYAAPPGMRCIANCHPVQGYGYYGAPVTTTVVIQSAPVVTTKVTTEEVVTYGGGRKVVRSLPGKRLYRAPAKVRAKTCNCR